MPGSYPSDDQDDSVPGALASENSLLKGISGGLSILYFTISSSILHKFIFCFGDLETCSSNSTLHLLIGLKVTTDS